MKSTIVWPDALVDKGKEAKARVDQGDKSLEKDENLYRSAGVILMEAKEIVKKTKGATWPGFLLHNCNISRSRADDFVRLANGETTLEELRAKTAARRETYNQKKYGGGTCRPDGKSSEKPKQKQEPVQTAEPEPPFEDIVEEARETLSEHDRLLGELIAQLRTYTTEQLKHAKVALTHV